MSCCLCLPCVQVADTLALECFSVMSAFRNSRVLRPRFPNSATTSTVAFAEEDKEEGEMNEERKDLRC